MSVDIDGCSYIIASIVRLVVAVSVWNACRSLLAIENTRFVRGWVCLFPER